MKTWLVLDECNSEYGEYSSMEEATEAIIDLLRSQGASLKEISVVEGKKSKIIPTFSLQEEKE